MIYKIAPYCPDVKFFFAGNLCNTLLKKKRPENVALLGLISEDMRRFLFSVFDMGLNPMYSGSGSNIKMFDYMSMGLPIVTSRFGARGIDDISMFHIADTEEELINTITKFCITDEVDAVQQARNEIEKIYDWRVIAQGVRDKILEYVTSLAMNTREQEMIRIGVSPRGALAVTRLAKARAYVQGRDYVTPEDVQKVFLDVCAHRIILNPKAKIAALSASDVLIEVLKQTKSPDNGR